MHLGDFDASAVIYGKFTTYRPSTGASFTLGGTPALSVYKDNSVTQSTTGVTLTADFDSVTGLNHFAIDTSADGTFYAAGSFFDIVITTGTVDSVSVTGSVVGTFTIRKNSALKPTTAGRALDVSAGGEAGLDWANVGSPTTALALTGTTIAVTQKVDVDTIKTNPVVNGGTITFPTTATLASTTNITAGTITTVSGNVSGSVGSVTGAVGSVTGNVGGNVTGSVGSVAAGGITASSIAADAIGASELAADAVAEIADAVWDELLSGHAVSGSTGEALSAAGTAGDPWTTALPGAYGAGTAGKIIGDNINATISSRMATYTQPTGFLAATFPVTVASTTNITAGTVTTATNVTTVNGLAAGVITAASIATDAIDADALAADAVTEIQSGLSTAAVTNAIKAKTDSLTFGVAGVVDANIEYVNATQIQGTGAVGTDEWRKV